jgi:hypothetical protein
LRDLAPLDEVGSGALPLEALDEVAKVLLTRRLGRCRADVLHAVRRLLPDVAPALSKIRLLEPLLKVAKPRLRLLWGLLRDPLQEG